MVNADQVAATDLAFDLVSEALQELLGWSIERGLQVGTRVRAGARHS
jgi:hypothetical protein